MKKARDFISMSKLSYKSRLIQFGIIEEWIKQAQLEAIEETVKLCAENAEVKYTFVSTGNYSGHDKYIVDKQSILNCADILKKKLE